MPACATPVMEGMKVQTRSPRPCLAAQNVMEFLLINHPLDCPICDQGGGASCRTCRWAGRSVSRFVEASASVADEKIGP